MDKREFDSINWAETRFIEKQIESIAYDIEDWVNDNVKNGDLEECAITLMRALAIAMNDAYGKDN